MKYELSDIAAALGEGYDPWETYILARKHDIPSKEREGFKVRGELPDFTTDEAGTMTIMSRPNPEAGAKEPNTP